MKIFTSLLLLILILFINGCAPKVAMLKVDALVANGEYKKAAKFSTSEISTRDFYAKNNLLWQLQSGSANLFAYDFNKSITHFNESENIIKYYNAQILAQELTHTITATLLNDTTRPYMGTQYDGIMLNTYKAINYMAKGDIQAARVEFNRAIDRQRRAKIFFNKMIQKERQAIDKKEKESLKKGKNLSVDDSKIDSILAREYPALHAYKPYPDFINPMTTYLAGIFAQADNNPSKANSLLQEAYGMMPTNKDVQIDLQKPPKEPMVWLIFENGQGPLLHEWRIDFPIWIFTGKLSYISVALPKLILRSNAYVHLNITLENNLTIESKFLCSMDRVIQTEYEKSYPSTVKRAIFSTATKAALNYALQESANNSSSGISALVSVASAIYQIASTQADTRIWSTLPKEFQLARFKRPKNGIVDIKTPNGLLIKHIDLPKKDNILIYVKIPTTFAKASVSVIPF